MTALSIIIASMWVTYWLKEIVVELKKMNNKL
jgi:hypothetical protein